MGKVGTVCIRCVLILHGMRVESRVFYPTISQRSFHVQHSKCNRNVAIHSTFNIQEFQAAYSPLYCIVSKCILHWKSAYSVHTVCSYIALNTRWIKGVLSDDIAAILPCTALHSAYFTWEKCIKSEYDVFLHCTESALNHGCFIQQYRSDPAMYSTLRATKI